jgi:hypothetical protein
MPHSLIVLAFTAFAADASVAHPHKGVVTAYRGAPPTVTLSEADKATLAAGKVLLKQQQVESGGRGVAMMDIHAAPERIWSKITDYAHYPQMVDKVAECSTYRVSGDHTFTRFVLSVMGTKVEYFIDHTVRPDLGYLTWTLDYSRKSDLDDSVGYWRITPLTSSPVLTRLEYSVDIRFTGYVPGFVADMISRKGLTDATSWVKRESEGS